MKLSFVLLVALCAICQLSAAVTITNSSPEALAAAIQAGGEVRLAFDGTVPLNSTLIITTNTTVDASGREVALDGGNAIRHFAITNRAVLRLINLALVNGRNVGRNGATNEDGAPAFGGSILNAGGRLELSGCKFLNNQAAGGNGHLGGQTTVGGTALAGAIYSSEGELAATNCTFAGNVCAGGQGWLDGLWPSAGDSYGGAVYGTNSDLSFNGNNFSNNMAQGSPASGGAIAQSGGILQIRQCLLLTNQVLGGPGGYAAGGALYFLGVAASIDESLFRSNSATGGWAGHFMPGGMLAYGGAIYVAGNLEMTRCAVVDNRATGGDGSVYGGGGSQGAGGFVAPNVRTGNARLVNCTFARNRARGGYGSSYGPGVAGALFSAFASAEDLLLLNVTIAENVTSGYYFPDDWPRACSLWGPATLTNTIFSCGPGQTNFSGDLVDGGHNICSDASARFTQPTSRNNLDPMLADLADNGGPTPTMALLPGSPAIDAGGDSVAPATDQRGVPRPVGAASDIGAFELTPTLSLARQAVGVVQVEYLFQPGTAAEIDVSTNLFNWLPLGTGTTDSQGRFTVQDTEAAQFSTRFYKAPLPAH